MLHRKTMQKITNFLPGGGRLEGGVGYPCVSFSPLSEYISSAYRFCITYHVSVYTRMPSQNRILVRKMIYYSYGHEIPSFQSSQTPITILQKATIKQHPSPAAPNRRLSLSITSVLILYTSNLTAFLCLI